MDLRDLTAALKHGSTVEDAAQHLCRSGTVDEVRRKAVNLLALEPILEAFPPEKQNAKGD